MMAAHDHVSPYQFRRRTDEYQGKREADVYTVYRTGKGPKPGQDEGDEIASMGIVHYPARPAVNEEHSPWSSGGYDYVHGESDPTRVVAQGTLFKSTPGTEARQEVHSLFARKEARHVTPTLLGMAQNVATSMGQPLRSPSDLSPYSSHMVGHLKRKGVVPTEAADRVQNDYSFSHGHHWAYAPDELHREGDVLDPAEISAGRTTMRKMLRQPKPPDHPTLF